MGLFWSLGCACLFSVERKQAYFSPLKTKHKKKCITIGVRLYFQQICLFFSVVEESSFLSGLVLMDVLVIRTELILLRDFTFQLSLI